jgi:UDP-glucuronate 4-epimerase
MGATADIKNSRYMITGAAGFIGFFLAQRLLCEGAWVIGIDNMNDYYDSSLKYHRLGQLNEYESFKFIKGDISDKELIFSLLEEYKPEIVINLAAQAGVRYSLVNPDAYISSNILGFYNILEACRYHPVKHLIYASSSSVYGSSIKIPFEETDNTDKPVSLYGATKKSNELMAAAYSHLYKIPATGLRFFTVYGPMGRPDMAYYSFADKFFSGEPIHIYNNGNLSNDLYRDFTYIDDIAEGIMRIINNPPGGHSFHEVYNIGNSRPVKLMDFIDILEKCLCKASGRDLSFNKVYEPVKPEDALLTCAGVRKLEEAAGFRPTVDIEEGLMLFAEWYTDYHFSGSR